MQFEISLSFSKRQLFPDAMNQPLCLNDVVLQETSCNTVMCYWKLLELVYLQVRTCCFLVNCYLYCFSNLLFRYDNSWQFHGSSAPFGSLTTTMLQLLSIRNCKHLLTTQSYIAFEEHTQWELIGSIVKPMNILFGFPAVIYLNVSNPEFPSIPVMFWVLS